MRVGIFVLFFGAKQGKLYFYTTEYINQNIFRHLPILFHNWWKEKEESEKLSVFDEEESFTDSTNMAR